MIPYRVEPLVPAISVLSMMTGNVEPFETVSWHFWNWIVNSHLFVPNFGTPPVFVTEMFGTSAEAPAVDSASAASTKEKTSRCFLALIGHPIWVGFPVPCRFTPPGTPGGTYQNYLSNRGARI